MSKSNEIPPMASAEQSAESSSDSGQVGVAAVNRALSILAAYSPLDKELTLAVLAQRTGLYKSTILRLIESLEAFGYIRRCGDSGYALGPAPLRLAAIYQNNLQPAELILPALRGLSSITTESASFYVIADGSRLCAYRVNSTRSIRDHVHVGQLLPLDRGAAGTVLLAFSGAEGRDYNQVRKQFFALSRGEREPETAALAAPVLGAGGKLEGALCISGPVVRFTDEAVAEMKPLILSKAALVSQGFGCDISLFPKGAASFNQRREKN